MDQLDPHARLTHLVLLTERLGHDEPAFALSASLASHLGTELSTVHLRRGDGPPGRSLPRLRTVLDAYHLNDVRAFRRTLQSPSDTPHQAMTRMLGELNVGLALTQLPPELPHRLELTSMRLLLEPSLPLFSLPTLHQTPLDARGRIVLDRLLLAVEDAHQRQAALDFLSALLAPMELPRSSVYSYGPGAEALTSPAPMRGWEIKAVSEPAPGDLESLLEALEEHNPQEALGAGGLRLLVLSADEGWRQLPVARRIELLDTFSCLLLPAR